MPAESGGTGAGQRAIVVVGAGRSGTSTIARGLQVLGVDLGTHLRQASWRNPRGFFEDEELLAISRRLRSHLGLGPKSVGLVAPEAYHAPEVLSLQREAAEVLRRRFAGMPLWGFKDGRTLRMLPFWEPVFAALEAELRFVVAVRNPLSVVRSRVRIQERKWLAPRLPPERAELMWLANVVPYFRRLATRRFVAVDYDQLLADPAGQLQRLAGALGLPAPRSEALQAYADSFLAPNLRHSRFGPDDVAHLTHYPHLTAPAYGWLRALACDDAAPDDPALWRDWRSLEGELAGMAPALREADRSYRRLRDYRLRLPAFAGRTAAS